MLLIAITFSLCANLKFNFAECYSRIWLHFTRVNVLLRVYGATPVIADRNFSCSDIESDAFNDYCTNYVAFDISCTIYCVAQLATSLTQDIILAVHNANQLIITNRYHYWLLVSYSWYATALCNLSMQLQNLCL